MEPPRRKLGSITEVNAARGPHTPVPAPPELRDAASTAPPPAPDRRPPPAHLRGPGVVVPRLRQSQPEWPTAPSDSTLVGLQPLPPQREKLDTGEISTGTLLAELASKGEQARKAEVALAARDAELAAKGEQARRAELENAELRKALQAERRAPEPRESLTPLPDRKAWLKLFYGLGGALTLFLGGAGTYLGARAATKEQKVDSVAADNSAQKAIVNPLPDQVAELERRNAALKEWARKHADFDRQVFAKLGVVIHPPANAKPVDPIKTTARVRKPNTVTSAPLLEVDTDPPELP